MRVRDRGVGVGRNGDGWNEELEKYVSSRYF